MREVDFPYTRHRKRLKLCYEIAGFALLGLKDDTEWRLCHGLKESRDLGFRHALRFGHAWLSRGDLVWDPVEAKTYPAGDYPGAVWATYTRAELCDHVSRGDTWGPWIDIPPIA